MAGRTRFSPEQIQTIVELYKEGNSYRQIQRLTKNMSLPTIHRLIQSRTLTPEQIEAKRIKYDATKKLTEAQRKSIEQINETTTKAMETIATTQAITESEQSTSSVYSEEYLKAKEQMKKLLSLANTNHKNAVAMVSEVMRNVAEKLQTHGKHMNMSDNKRVMEVLDLGADVMEKVFNTLGFDIRNELIQLSMRKEDDKRTPMLRFVNNQGEVIDLYEREYTKNYIKRND